MAAENQSFRAGTVLYRALQHKSEFKPGSLPWEPRDLPSELPVKLIELLFPVSAGGKRDRPVRMQVVHMVEWKECMQCSIDRRRYPAFTKCRERIVADHFVFIFLATINLFQLVKAVEVQNRKA